MYSFLSLVTALTEKLLPETNSYTLRKANTLLMVMRAVVTLVMNMVHLMSIPVTSVSAML